MTGRSFQERVLRELSSHIFGNQMVFKPKLYGNGEEPADLIWHFGRSIVLVNATSGKKSLEAKKAHNQAQAHRWLRRWKAGEPLRGGTAPLDYQDIDYILVLSIVGGRDAASGFEAEQTKFARSKGHGSVYGYATLSDKVFQRLCVHSIGVRDFLYFVEFLRDRDGIVHDIDALIWIDSWEREQIINKRVHFAQIIPSNRSLDHAWNSILVLFRSISNIKEPNINISPAFADLSIGDAAWLGVAERSLASQLAPPGQFGHLVASARRDIGDYSIRVVVAAHLGILNDPKNHDLVNPTNTGDAFTLISSLEWGIESPMRMIALNPTQPPINLYKHFQKIYVSD